MNKCIENELIMHKTLLLISFFIGLVSTQAQIVNKGILKIESGTTVYFGDDYTNKSGAVHDNDGDLHLNGDFTNDGIVQSSSTTLGDGITYFDSPTNVSATENAIQTLKGSSNTAQFNNLVVNNTSASAQGLAVSDGYNLEVTNGVTLTSGKLRLMGEAQLIQTHAGSSANSGNGHLLKDQEGAQNAYRYNYWSSPVNTEINGSYKVTQMLKDGSTADLWDPQQVGFVSEYDGNNATSPISLSSYWFYKYINGVVDPYNSEGWLSLFDLGTTTESSNAEISPAQGFIMKGTNTSAAYADLQNYSFEGKPNDGEYLLPIANNQEYLVGNPYPSAIDANQFIDDNIDFTNGEANPIIDGTLYYWHHWSTNTHVYTEYGGNYAAYTKTGGVAATSSHEDFMSSSNPDEKAPKRYIPVGQGFIVRSETTSGGNIIFNNNQRTFMLEGDDSTQFRLNTTNETGVLTKIRLGYVGPDEMHRQLLLGFTSGTATDSFDYGYDGKMLEIGSDDMFFTMSDEGRNFPYVIQGVGAYNVEASYPLTIKVATDGEHRIILDETENFEQDIYILDKNENTTYDIRENDFTVNLEAGTYSDRFEVVFQPQAPLEIENYLNDLVNTYYTNEEIVIQNSHNITLTGLQVFNSLGQLVYQNNNQGQLSATEVRIPFKFVQAAYVLKLQATEGKGTYKFINY